MILFAEGLETRDRSEVRFSGAQILNRYRNGKVLVVSVWCKDETVGRTEILG